MSAGFLIAVMAGVITSALVYSILLEALLGYRKERRHRRDRRVCELRQTERRQSPFPWNGTERRQYERRDLQRRVLDRRHHQKTQAA